YRLEPRILIGAAQLVEVPPGDAVDRRHQRGLRADQRANRVGRGQQRMCLDGQHHVVLWTELARVVGGMGGRHQRLSFAEQLYALFLERLRGRSGGKEGNARPRKRKLGSDVPADCARTEDANFHAADSEGAKPSLAARPMRCSFPVAPFGISAKKTIFLGTLNSGRRHAAKSFSSRSVRLCPSRRT